MRLNVKLTAALVLLCCLAAAAQQWVAYSPPDKSFAVSFPGKADILANDAKRFHVQHSNKPAKTAYMVTWAAVPGASKLSAKDKKTALAQAEKAMAKAAKMTVSAQKEIDYQGNPGYDLTGSLQGLACSARMMLVGDRLYQLTIVSPKLQPAASISKFFNSFKTR